MISFGSLWFFSWPFFIFKLDFSSFWGIFVPCLQCHGLLRVTILRVAKTQVGVIQTSSLNSNVLFEIEDLLTELKAGLFLETYKILKPYKYSKFNFSNLRDPI